MMRHFLTILIINQNYEILELIWLSNLMNFISGQFEREQPWLWPVSGWTSKDYIKFYEHLMNLKIKMTLTIWILFESYSMNHTACKLYAYSDQKSSDLFTILILQKIAFGLTLFDIQDIFDLFTDFYLRYLIYLVHQSYSKVHRLWTICPIFDRFD